MIRTLVAPVLAAVPVAGAVAAASASGSSALTDATGRARLALARGRYLVRAERQATIRSFAEPVAVP